MMHVGDLVFGDVLAEIGVKSTQPDAHRALTLFGSVHRYFR